MKSKNSLTPADVAVLVAEWKRPKGERMTQAEAAARFGVAVVTVRRALVEHGLAKLSDHKTTKDAEILDFLESQGLNDLKKLTQFVVKARQGKSVK